MATPLEMLNQWNDRLTGIADALQAKAPLALAAVRVEALNYLIGGGVVAAGACAATAWLAMKLARRCRGDATDEIIFLLGAIGLGVTTIVFGVIAVVNLGDLWNWVALFHPDLYIAKKIILGGKS